MKFNILTGLLLAPTTAFALDLTDYKEVNSSYENAYINGQMSARDGNQDQASYNLNVSGDYNLNISTQQEVKDFSVTGNAAASRGSAEEDTTVKAYDVEGRLNYSSYFNNDSNAFWFGGVELGFRRLASQTETDDPRSKVSGGLGYGRIINATPLAQSIKVLDRLHSINIIKQKPGDELYHRLAKIIDQEDAYRGRYDADEWEERWLTDIMAFIETNVASYDKASEAVAVLSVRDMLIEESINTRKHGYLVKVGTGYIMSNYEGEDETPSIDLYAEYAKPIGLKTQFINAAQLSFLEDSASDYLFSNDMSLTYELDDKIDWENGWRMEYANGENDLVTNSAYTSLSFELTNALDLTTTYQVSHLNDQVDDNGNDDVEQSLFVGVRYRLK